MSYGYVVNIHKKAKKPTKASINYINSLQAKQIRENPAWGVWIELA